MDVERACLSKVVHTGQTEVLVHRGIRPEHFVQEDCREVWEFLMEHVRRYRTPPSFSMVSERFPGFQFMVVADALEAVVDQLIKTIKRRALIEATRDLAKIADDPVAVADAELHVLEKARDLAKVVPGRRVSRHSDMLDRIEMFKERQRLGYMPGIPSYIPTIDNALVWGFQPHEYITITGWTGLGKSHLASRILHRAYVDRGIIGLLISLEDEASVIQRRWDAMTADISQEEIKKLTLGNDKIAHWEEVARRVRETRAKKDLIVIDDLRRCTVDDVYAEMERYSPDICVVDNINLMDVPSRYRSRWEQVGYLTKELKAIARMMKIPIIGIAQAGADAAEQGATLENIAESKSVVRDSDIVIGLHQDAQMFARKEMQIRLLKNRDGPRTHTSFYWGVEELEFREWKPSDTMGARRVQPVEDVEGDPTEAANGAA